MKLHKLLFAALLISLGVPQYVKAAVSTWYVDGANGTDAVSCGTAKDVPCRTLGYNLASARLNAHDTILIKRGTICRETLMPLVRHDDLTITSNTDWAEGTGANPVIDADTHNISRALLCADENITISNIDFRGDKDGESSSDAVCFVITGENNCTVSLRNADISNGRADGLRFHNTGTGTLTAIVSKVTSHDNNNDGFKQSAGNIAVQYTNITAYNNFFTPRSGSSDGLSLHGGTATITAATFYNNDNGISNFDGTSCTVSGAVIYNNAFWGIRLLDPNHAPGTITADNCTLYDNPKCVGSSLSTGTITLNNCNIYTRVTNGVGIELSAGTLKATGCYIHDCTLYGIYQWSSASTVTLNQCYMDGTNIGGDIVKIAAGAAATLNANYSIFYKAHDSVGDYAVDASSASAVNINNCVITACRYRGTSLLGTASVYNTVFKNNTYLDIIPGISLVEQYNCFNGTATAVSGRSIHETDLTADPQFADETNQHFWLSPSSPCIDTGSNLGESLTDGLMFASSWPVNILTLNQNNFGNGWERGAYVVQGQSDADNDGIPDNADNCPETPNGSLLGTCMPGADRAGAVCTSDADCVTGCSSNGTCLKNQQDTDQDGLGDICDPDIDGDGVPNGADCQPVNPTAYPGAPEQCNGSDDDCDDLIDEDFNIGQPCTAGVGACAQPGAYVCAGDGTGTVCNATPGAPAPELCADGIDNDCDGLTDCADPDCSGNSCDDGNLCTENDICGNGTCTGTPKNCDDGNPCTWNVCDPAVGCQNPTVANGTSCDDGNGCTVGDVCTDGTCVSSPISCDDGKSCTDDSCEAGQCLHACAAAGAGDACCDTPECSASPACQTAGYWKFDEGAGTLAQDSSGSGNAGTIYGNAQWTSHGACAAALVFDGTDDFVKLPTSLYNFGTNPFAITAYIKTAMSGGTVYMRYSILGNGIMVNLEGGKIHFGTYYNNQVSDITGTHVAADSRWHHVGCVREADGTLKIYIDGVLDAEEALPVRILNPSVSPRIGCDSRSLTGFFNGTIDEVRIYSRPLAEAEILGLMNRCAPDSDSDGIPDSEDNCPALANPDQADADGDGAGDGCDDDMDGDGVPNSSDCGPQDPAVYPGAAEQCNGSDDDCDILIDEDFNVGQPCTAGVGACAQPGAYVCAGDGTGTVCNATPGAPAPELCADGIDNDCDGLTDCADPDCSGTSCDDSNLCTENDICGNGTCTGTPKNCDDGNPCTWNTCDPVAGCLYPAVANGTSCDDGQSCTDDACEAGQCLHACAAAGAGDACCDTPECSASPTCQTAGYWKFDEGAGTLAQDSSGSGNTGTIYGNAQWTSHGACAAALVFDGIDDFVKLPTSLYNFGTNPFAITTYIKTAVSGTGTIYMRMSALNNGVAVTLTGDKIHFGTYYNNQVSDITGTHVAADGRWHHIACVREADGTLQIYFDGVLDAEATLPVRVASTSAAPRIGCDSRSLTAWFNGVIDEVRIYSRSLAEAEILGLMNRCAPDSDSDGIPDSEDNCPALANPDQADADGDGAGDVCDNCPDMCNTQQLDADTDGSGDVCDPEPGCGGCGGVQCETQCS